MQQQTMARLAGGLAGVALMALMATGVGLSAAAAGAQDQRPAAGRRGPGGPGGPGRGAGFGPGFDLPGLTEAQRAQARDIRERHRDEIRTLSDQVRQAHQGLQASIESGQPDEVKAAELGTATGSLALAQARVQAEIFALLTPEQRTQLKQRRDAMKAWMDARPGAPGDRPGRGGRGRP
jgi:Spy/CpxP family protein refolding chaperone